MNDPVLIIFPERSGTSQFTSTPLSTHIFLLNIGILW